MLGAAPEPPQGETQEPSAAGVAENDPEAQAGQESGEADGPRECVLILTNGRMVHGMFVSRDEQATVVRIAGVESRFDASDIADFRLLEPLGVQYEKMRDAIDDEDVQSLLVLGEWLRQREMYTEALHEIDAVLEIEPFHPRANRLRTWLVGQISMRKSGSRGDSPRERVSIARSKRADFPLLSPEEINLIRVYEVDLTDPPRMIIKRETIDELLREFAGDARVGATLAEREALYKRPAHEVLEIMFRLRARDLYGQVRVMQDPPAMALFKKKIHGRGGWLANSCASVRCHGGANAGRLWLTGRRSNSDAAVYTNFYILDQFRLADGTPLIDYKEPTRSPLLHMGVRRSNSLFPHPDTEQTRGAHGWRPIFRDAGDRKFLRGVEWVRSLYRPRPDYPIAYEPPDPTGWKPGPDGGAAVAPDDTPGGDVPDPPGDDDDPGR